MRNHNDHIRNFIEVCSPFSLKEVKQESIRLRLFLFSLKRVTTKWIARLPRDSILSWADLTDVLYVRFFQPSNSVKLCDNIQNFNRVEGELIHETWLRYRKLLLQYPSHGLLGDLILQYFYRILDLVNK